MKKSKLTGKDLEKLFATGNEELRTFARDLYARVREFNPNREVYDRELIDRRFDALARLLVGDEVCASIAFNGDNLLISTNLDNHHTHHITYSINCVIKAGSLIETGYVMQPVLYFSHSGSQIRLGPIPGPLVHYHFDSSLGMLRTNNNTNIRIVIDPADHLIPFLPAVDIGITAVLNEIIPLPMTPVIISGQQIFLKIPRFYETDVEEKTQFNDLSTAIDPLVRRAQVLVEHLSFIALVRVRELEGVDLPSIGKINDAIEKNRAKFLEQSLAWEAASWYNSKKKLLNFRDLNDKATLENRLELSVLLRFLSEDFYQYREAHYSDSISSLVRQWGLSVLDRIKTVEISIPKFMEESGFDITRFLGRALRYFIDLEKIECFVRDDVEGNGALAIKLLKSEGPGKIKSLVKIVDGVLGGGIHTEIRLLCDILLSGKKVSYIGISMLSCPMCKVALETNKEGAFTGTAKAIISGIHASLFGKWPLGSLLVNKKFLKVFLGDQLYEQFEDLGECIVKEGNKNVTYDGEDWAVLMIESLGVLNEKLNLIDYKGEKIWSIHFKNTPPLSVKDVNKADESDDEEGDGFNLVPIAIDGNCMYNAVLRGMNNDQINHFNLRNIVVREIEDHFDNYQVEIANQILDAVQTGEIYGYRGDILAKIQKLHSIREALLARGGEDYDIDTQIYNYIITNDLARDYINTIHLNAVWGGDVELGIIARHFNVGIIVHRNAHALPINNDDPSLEQLHLRLNHGHYDLLEIEEEVHNNTNVTEIQGDVDIGVIGEFTYLTDASTITHAEM